MPKEMLLEKAQELRAIADSLEEYAGGMEEGEEEGEMESPSAPPSKPSMGAGAGSGKMKIALAGLKKGMGY